MALLITDTHDGLSKGTPCAVVCGTRMQAGAVFVGEKERTWRC